MYFENTMFDETAGRNDPKIGKEQQFMFSIWDFCNNMRDLPFTSLENHKISPRLNAVNFGLVLRSSMTNAYSQLHWNHVKI